MDTVWCVIIQLILLGDFLYCKNDTVAYIWFEDSGDLEILMEINCKLKLFSLRSSIHLHVINRANMSVK